MTDILLKIGEMTVPHLVSYKISRAKLWKDAERNMNGDVRATLIGIFPKIQVQIGYTSEVEMRGLINALDQDKFKVEWYDPRDREIHEGYYYAGDYDVELDSKEKERYHD